MPPIHSLHPIAAPSARILVLGTMPGKASLAAGRYYAHPRNVFWRIIGDALGVRAGATYAERTAALMAAGIAIWDVLQLCTRESSLDSDIDPATVVINDFSVFLREHSGIERIGLNGGKAAALFTKHVVPTLSLQQAGIARVTLPSTSPANTTMPYSEKLRLWRAALAR